MDLKDISYKGAKISGHETALKNRIVDFVESFEGKTDDEKRSNLPKIRVSVLDCVSYVARNLPKGVDKVDGWVIQPLLDEVVKGKLKELVIVNDEEL